MISDASLIGEKYAKALKLRKDGLTYKEIGNEIGVSTSRARQLVLRAEYRLKTGYAQSPLNGISTKTKNLLLSAGYSSKEAVRAGVVSGDINPSVKSFLNYGLKAHIEVCEWLGLEFEKKMVEKPRKPTKTIEKYIKFLEDHNYKVTKIVE